MVDPLCIHSCYTCIFIIIGREERESLRKIRLPVMGWGALVGMSLILDALLSSLVLVEEMICALLWKKVPFKKSKYYNCMFSRHCIRVQILSGGNSLIFTTSLTGRICWTLRSGERITKSMGSFWEGKVFFFVCLVVVCFVV